MYLQIRIRIFPDRILILSDPDQDSGKKVRSGQKDPDPKHWYTVLYRVCNYINTGTSWRHKACINIYIYRLPVPRFDENVDFLNLILSLEYKSAKSDSENYCSIPDISAGLSNENNRSSKTVRKSCFLSSQNYT